MRGSLPLLQSEVPSSALFFVTRLAFHVTGNNRETRHRETLDSLLLRRVYHRATWQHDEGRQVRLFLDPALRFPRSPRRPLKHFRTWTTLFSDTLQIGRTSVQKHLDISKRFFVELPRSNGWAISSFCLLRPFVNASKPCVNASFECVNAYIPCVNASFPCVNASIPSVNASIPCVNAFTAPAIISGEWTGSWISVTSADACNESRLTPGRGVVKIYSPRQEAGGAN